MKGGAFCLYVQAALRQSVVAFSLEQYCQLMLKYKLLVKFGSYPRTHMLRRLIRGLAWAAPSLKVLVEDKENLHYVRLEEAYVTSRYLPYSYEEKEARSLHRFVVERFEPLVDGVS
ncbi:MAG: HEPN domain-containing protein [Candidatus Bathyarchaeota archaeon]|nr:HEPN domain-containing protein [Candidatus Bathyarchaeota archaeon]